MQVNQWQAMLDTTIKPLRLFTVVLEGLSVALDWLGLLGSILIFFTVFSKKKILKNSFYITLVVVAALDSVFVILKFSRWSLKTVAATSNFAGIYSNYAVGLAYTRSLMSDMLTVALTLERFIALTAAIFHKNLTAEKKRVAWTVMVLFSILIASTRKHYSLVNFQFGNPQLANQPWFMAVTYFSDTVIPFLLTAIMFQSIVHAKKAAKIPYNIES